VLTELRGRISDGSCRPGSKLVAEQIGAELGVSRVPVREALKVLEGEGQVVYEPHRGYYVAELSWADLEELYRLRELLEEEAIRASVPRLSSAALDRIADDVADADRASAAGELSAYAQANRRFHLDLFAASERPLLLRTIRQLWDASDAYRAIYANDRAHRDAAAAAHRRILSALVVGDVERAVEAQAAHRAHALEALRGVLASNDG
jgi:DNA-binding GntR family transcriptional regulator